MSNLKGISHLVSGDVPENQDVALRLPSAPWRQHFCTIPGGTIFWQGWEWSPTPWLYDSEPLLKLLHFYLFVLCPE